MLSKMELNRDKWKMLHERMNRVWWFKGCIYLNLTCLGEQDLNCLQQLETIATAMHYEVALEIPLCRMMQNDVCPLHRHCTLPLWLCGTRSEHRVGRTHFVLAQFQEVMGAIDGLGFWALFKGFVSRLCWIKLRHQTWMLLFLWWLGSVFTVNASAPSPLNDMYDLAG